MTRSDVTNGGRLGMTVAIVGLGAMGRPIAHRVIAAGFAVRVTSRGDSLAAEFIDAGATWCASPAEVAAGADVILIVVATEQDLADVLDDPGRVVASLRPGTIVCDLGTHSPDAMIAADAAVRAVGAVFLDTPVSGGVVGANAGSLSLMAGGPEHELGRVRPVLEAFASTIVRVGPVGSGAVAKACNQLVVGSTIQAVAEAITLARMSGLDPARVREAMLGGFAASRVLENHGQRMLDRAFAPGGRVDLHAKDARIVLDQARRVGLRLPGFEPVAAALEELVAAGDGGLDHAALITLLNPKGVD
jgi:3-hydroxyisobutyrate dehydrogenase-like beta-hydroxyacid dehydrogenase